MQVCRRSITWGSWSCIVYKADQTHFEVNHSTKVCVPRHNWQCLIYGIYNGWVSASSSVNNYSLVETSIIWSLCNILINTWTSDPLQISSTEMDVDSYRCVFLYLAGKGEGCGEKITCTIFSTLVMQKKNWWHTIILYIFVIKHLNFPKDG